MSQQVNLCFPILLAPKRYFSAATMVQTLGIFALVGGGLCAYAVRSLHVASANLQPTLARQSTELQSLQSALARTRAGGVSTGAVLAQELVSQRAELVKRETLLEELQRGLMQPGAGYAARLQLVAQSIPSQVWVTELSANENRLEVRGFTLEPSELNDWAIKLAQSPLLGGQKLVNVKVENATESGSKTSDGMAVAAMPSTSAAARPAWAFSMVSAVRQASAPIGTKP